MNIKAETQNSVLEYLENGNPKSPKEVKPHIITRIIYGIFISAVCTFCIAIVILALYDLVTSYIAGDYQGIYKCADCKDSFTSMHGYCDNCGKKHDTYDYVETMSKCTSCGRDGNATDRHCKSCGGKLARSQYIPIYTIDNVVVRLCVVKRLCPTIS